MSLGYRSFLLHEEVNYSCTNDLVSMTTINDTVNNFYDYVTGNYIETDCTFPSAMYAEYTCIIVLNKQLIAVSDFSANSIIISIPSARIFFNHAMFRKILKFKLTCNYVVRKNHKIKGQRV